MSARPRASQKPRTPGLPSTAPCIFRPEGRTDAANARRLVLRSGNQFRYSDQNRAFFVWGGKCWNRDSGVRMEGFAKETARELFSEISLSPSLIAESTTSLTPASTFARQSNSAKGIRGMLDLVRSEPGILIDGDQFDRNPMLLNVRNGTFDLGSGALRPHAPDDLITKLCPVDFDATAGCPRWTQFIDDVFQKDADLIRFVQRAAGYALTGDVREQVLFLCVGNGANGKSVFLNLLLRLLGADYAMKAPHDLLVATKQRGHPTELADLRGKRFVAAIETGAYQRLDETLVKELTGGDPIRARRICENYAEFLPEHKFWLATNHRPQIQGTDEGIWRRVVVIPFKASFLAGSRDETLSEKLRSELPGILNWCLDGLPDWRNIGLGTCSAVSNAVAEFRSEMDVVARFLTERCVRRSGHRIKASVLQSAIKAWCSDQGLGMPGSKEVSRALENHGILKSKSSVVWYEGLELIS